MFSFENIKILLYKLNIVFKVRNFKISSYPQLKVYLFFLLKWGLKT